MGSRSQGMLIHGCKPYTIVRRTITGVVLVFFVYQAISIGVDAFGCWPFKKKKLSSKDVSKEYFKAATALREVYGPSKQDLNLLMIGALATGQQLTPLNTGVPVGLPPRGKSDHNFIVHARDKLPPVPHQHEDRSLWDAEMIERNDKGMYPGSTMQDINQGKVQIMRSTTL